MLQALGASLIDSNGKSLPPGGINLLDLENIDWNGLDSRLDEVVVEAALDVDNPLVGKQGASAIFGPKKGTSPEDIEILYRALDHFADIVSKTLGSDFRNIAGAGAAGGSGFSAFTFLKAKLPPVIELVMSHVEFEDKLSRADLVITGEGSLDEQSISGKTPVGISRHAQKFGVPVVEIAGRLGIGWKNPIIKTFHLHFLLLTGQ